MSDKFTFAKHIHFYVGGEVRYAEVIPSDEAEALYRRTQCGFGPEFDTEEAAQRAAESWERGDDLDESAIETDSV